jgi:hypothetical protein
VSMIGGSSNAVTGGIIAIQSGASAVGSSGACRWAVLML